jgi:hypothetical protein
VYTKCSTFSVFLRVLPFPGGGTHCFRPPWLRSVATFPEVQAFLIPRAKLLWHKPPYRVHADPTYSIGHVMNDTWGCLF